MLRLNLNSITILEHTYNHKYSRCVSQPFSQSVAYSLSTPPSFTPFQYTSTTQQKKNMRNNFIENFWKGWSYIYIPFWRGPPRLSCWKKTWVKMSNLSPPQKNPLDETAGTYVCGPLPWRVPESTCQSWWKFPTGSRKGRTVYLYIYMKNHQNRRNVGTYASPMIPMGMIENSGVVGGGGVKDNSWTSEVLI